MDHLNIKRRETIQQWHYTIQPQGRNNGSALRLKIRDKLFFASPKVYKQLQVFLFALHNVLSFT